MSLPCAGSVVLIRRGGECYSVAGDLYRGLVELLIAHGQAAGGAADPTLDTDQLVSRLSVRGYAPDRVLVNLYLGQLARQGYVRTASPTPGTLVVREILVPALQRLL